MDCRYFCQRMYGEVMRDVRKHVSPELVKEA